MKKRILTAYFSASGVTKAVAQKLADAIGADIFEIEPKIAYTADDLDWHDKNSRSTLEMNDVNSRPEIIRTVTNPQDYDILLIGFPVWWYAAPTIINTFLESADFKGKTIALFCTSGGTGIEGCEKKMQQTYGNQYVWKSGKRFTGRESSDVFAAWAKSL